MGEGRTVWLVGMMGAGKSAVGRLLAARLGLPFLDTDAEVEREAGCTIADLFAREGEAVFRRRERAAIERCAGRAAVVALGGGAMAQPGAAERLAGSGTVVYLKAGPEALLARVGEADERPLLKGLDHAGRLAEIGRLLARRAPCYEKAEVVVETEGRDPQAVAEAVEEALS
jgi:shikimate kinase